MRPFNGLRASSTTLLFDQHHHQDDHAGVGFLVLLQFEELFEKGGALVDGEVLVAFEIVDAVAGLEHVTGERADDRDALEEAVEDFVQGFHTFAFDVAKLAAVG